MMKSLKQLTRSTLGRFGLGHYYSYSQYGEDLIIRALLYMIGVGHPVYLDIGANQPRELSNTYLFYSRGAKGVCVEPDPGLVAMFRRARPLDTCLNIGVANEDTSLDFYIMSDSVYNTFSRTEAEKYVGFGNQRIEKIIKVPCLPINTLIERYFDTPIDFMTLDVEGNDFEIIKSMDFSLYRPKVICVETILYSEDGSPVKQDEIIRYISDREYMIFADTFLNTIFVDRNVWDKRVVMTKSSIGGKD